ncbi:hypothetical protein ASF00_07470 [Sphingomonas sp. Leaf34]|nr:hypothetical protein ASF00_07470 [Sphingomonas sp. Leaf34]
MAKTLAMIEAVDDGRTPQTSGRRLGGAVAHTFAARSWPETMRRAMLYRVRLSSPTRWECRAALIAKRCKY